MVRSFRAEEFSYFSTAAAVLRAHDGQALDPARLEDIADALVFALRYSGRKRVQRLAEIMATILPKGFGEL